MEKNDLQFFFFFTSLALYVAIVFFFLCFFFLMFVPHFSFFLCRVGRLRSRLPNFVRIYMISLKF